MQNLVNWIDAAAASIPSLSPRIELGLGLSEATIQRGRRLRSRQCRAAHFPADDDNRGLAPGDRAAARTNGTMT
jgi:hypothetical protein